MLEIVLRGFVVKPFHLLQFHLHGQRISTKLGRLDNSNLRLSNTRLPST